MQGHLAPRDFHLNKLGKDHNHSFDPNFKHLSQVILKKEIFEYFFMYFYDLNLGPPGAGPSSTLGPSFE